ncbi:MEDS domain-containing protein [Pseudonocardia sp. T1-2H]|uniref:MEDS domain-containing protein n=1 Tax=Pseudonocardia sp. T1-2H TaxID=3128899 RepID=UPI003101A57D
MRVAGELGEARGYGLQDHLCFVFDAPAEFDRQARLFLAEGLERGCRVLYVGDSPPSAAELAGARPGAVRVAPAAATYGAGPVVDPRGQVREYAAAVAEALTYGFTGHRGVLLLAELGRGWGGEIVLRNAPYGTRKLIGLLEPKGVRVEVAA